MAYRFTPEGGFGADAAVIPADAAHPDYVRVPDAALLFNGAFRRAGPDLVLTGEDGRHHIVPGYFAGAHRPALLAPNGAGLSADVIELLAGSPTPGEYAQTQPTTPPAPIGKVEKVVGNATVIRNGVAVVLHVGDPIYKSDVVQTGSGSSVGISFPDGTALNLIANTRMALTDFSYDPNGHSNTALLNLVEGTFAFVAGKVAHTGDMKIETPVATMGIRGTTGYVQEVASVTANLGNVSYSFAVVGDYGTNRVGRYELIDANGNVIATVSQSGYVTYVTPQGPGQAPLVTTAPMTNSQFGFEQGIIQQVFQVLNSNVNPQAPGTPGSSTQPPPPVPPFPQLFHENNGQQLNFNIQGPGGSGSVTVGSGQYTVSPTDTWSATTIGSWITAQNWNQGAPPLEQQIVVLPSVPLNLLPSKVTLATAVSVSGLEVGSRATLNIGNGGSFTIAGTIDNNGTVQLNSSGSDPKLVLSGDVLVLGNGQIAMLGPSGDNFIIAAGRGSILTNVGNTIGGTGTIGHNGDGALTLVNGVDGIIVATPTEVVPSGQTVTSSGLLVIDTGNAINNSGVLEGGAGGTLRVYDVVDNAGLLEAAPGGVLDIKTTEIFWTGATATPGITGIWLQGAPGTAPGELLIDVAHLTLSGPGGAMYLTGGAIEGAAGVNILENVDQTISGYGTIGVPIGDSSGALTLINDAAGVIDADSTLGTLLVDTGHAVSNAGLLEASGGGTLQIDDGVTNANMLLATGADSTIVLAGETFTNSGGSAVVEVDAGAVIELQAATITGGTINVTGTLDAVSGGNEIDGGAAITIAATTGTLEATGGALTLDTGVTIINDGTLEAADSGSPNAIGATLTIDDDVTNAGTLLATGKGTLVLDGDTVTNTGTVEVDRVDSTHHATLDLENATISGGALNVYGLLDSADTTTESYITGLTLTDTGGTIEASAGTLVLDVGGTIANTGTLEANGGTLQIYDNEIDNSGNIEVDSVFSLHAVSGELTLDDGGTVTLAGGSVEGFAAGQPQTLENNGNTISGYGSIGNADALTLDNNAGIIAAAGGTLFLDTGANTIVNAGILAATSGGDLTIDSDVNNSGGAISIAGAATLELAGVTVSGGSIEGADATVGSGSIIASDIEVTGTSKVESAALSNGTVTVEAHQALTLDDDTVNGTTFTDTANGAVLAVDGGATLTLDAVTISGGTLDDGSATSGATIYIEDEDQIAHAALNDGTVTIDANATLTLNGVTLDDVTLSGGSDVLSGGVTVSGSVAIDGATIEGNNNAITVDGSGTLTLNGVTLEDVTLSGGSDLIGGDGLTVSGAATISGATVDGGDHTITVDDAGALTLNGVTLDDVTLSGGGDLIGSDGLTVSGAATISGATVDGGDHTITVDGSGTLTLNGVTLEDVTLSGGSDVLSGGVTVSGSVAIDGATVEGNTNTISVDGATLTLTTVTLEDVTLSGGSDVLSGGVTVSGAATISGATVDGGDHTITLDDGGTLTLNGVTLYDVTLSGGSDLIGGDGLTVSGGAEIDGATIDGNGNTINVGGATLTLNAVTLDDVTLSGGSDLIGSDGLMVSGSAEIDGATIDGNNNTISVDGATLTFNGVTLDDVTLSGGSDLIGSDGLTVSGAATISGATVDGGDHTITVDDGGTLTLNGVTLDDVTLSGGSDVLSGGVTVSGSVAIDGATVEGNTNTISVDGATLTLTTMTLEDVTLSGGSDVLSGGVTVSGSVAIDGATIEGNNNAITVDGSGTLTLNGVTLEDVTLSGGSDVLSGSVTVSGSVAIEGATIEGNNNAITVDGSGTLTLNGVTLDDVTLSGGSDVLSGGVTVSGSVAIDGATVEGNTNTISVDGATLTLTTVTLEDVTLSGGSDVLSGGVTVSGAATISGATVDGGDHTITLDDGGTLTLNGVTLYDVTLSGGSDLIGSDGLTVSGAATISGATVDGGDHTITVDDGGTLTLNGVTLEDVTLSGGSDVLSGGVTVSGSVAIDGATVEGNTNTISVDGATLTLTTMTLEDVTLSGGSDVLSGGVTVSGSVAIDGATIEGNNNAITVDGSGTLTLNGVTLEDVTLSGGSDVLSGSVTVSGSVAIEGATIEGNNNAITVDGSGTLTLNGVTLDDVTLSGGSDVLSGGVTVNGSVAIDGATVEGNTNTISVDGATLTLTTMTLDDVTLSGGSDVLSGGVTVSGSVAIDGATIEGNNNAITVDGSGTLTLNGVTLEDVTLSGGSDLIGGDGLTVSGAATISGATVDGGDHTITVDDGGTLTLNGVTLDDVTLSGGSDVLSGGVTVSGSAEIASATVDGGGHTITVDSGATLTLDGATLSGGNINDIGTIVVGSGDAASTVDVGTLTVASGAYVEADGGKLTITEEQSGSTNSGTIEAISGGTLTISHDDGSGAANFGTITADGGTVNLNDNAGVANDGMIEALDGGVVNIDLVSSAGSGGGNAGTIEATSGGTVAITGDFLDAGVDNVSGHITADGFGSTVQLVNVGIGGGTLTTDDPTLGDAGLIEIVSPTSGSNIAVFDGETSGVGAPGQLTIDAFVEVQAAADLVLIGAIDNTGAISLEAATSPTALVIDGPVSLSGTGAVTLNGNNDFIVGAMGVTGNAFDNVSTVNGVGSIGGNGLALDNESGGAIDANVSGAGNSISINTGTDHVINAGIIEATDGGSLAFTGATIDNTNAIELQGTDAAPVRLIIDGSLTLQGAGDGQLEMTGDSETAILSNLSAATLTNVNNTISGSGTIGDQYLTLDNKADGIIDANGGSGNPLVINTGSDIVANAGTLEATGGSTLQIDSDVDNSGTIEASSGSTLDIFAASISWTGTAAPATGQGIVLVASSDILKVDTPVPVGVTRGTLTLTGDGFAGVLSLGGGTIQAGGHAVTLDNSDNTISGAGTIGLGDGYLVLENDAGGTIDATGGALVLDTGNTIDNAGLLEATSGGTLDVQDGGIDNSGVGPNSGILIDGTSTLLVDTADLQLTGSGTLTLEAGSQIIENINNPLVSGSSATALTLENVSGTISGAGTIGLGDGYLVLENDAGGTIDATGGALVLDTGNTIDNAGLLEATSGGTLDVQDGGIDNSGVGPNSGILIDGTSTLLVDTADLQLTGSGTLTLEAGSQIIENIDNPLLATTGSYLTLDNVDNIISGAGTIGLGDGHLALENDAGGTIDADLAGAGNSISINTGTNHVINAGIIEATDGGTLQIDSTVDNTGTGTGGIIANGGTVDVDAAVIDTGAASISNNGVLEFQSSVANTQTITFTDATGTLAIGDAGAFQAAIAGFGANGAGNTIDLTNVAYNAPSTESDVWAQTSNQNGGSGTLAIYNGATLEATLHLAGIYNQSDFALTQDGGTGTDVVWSSPASASVAGLDNAGNPVNGYAVTAELTGETATSYTWLENGTIVGTSQSYQTGPSDVGNPLDVVIGFVNGTTAEQITELAGTVAAPPAVSFGVASPVSTNENTVLTLNSLGLTFTDAGSDTITATLDLAANGDTAHGTLTFGASSGVTDVDGAAVTDNGSADVTLSGTLFQIDAALASGVTYTSNSGFLGTDTLTFSASDAATGTTFDSNTGALSITVVPDHWADSSGGDWNTGSDWSFGSPPSSGVDAVIDASGAYVVTISSLDVAEANSLTITAAGAGADIQDETGGSLTLTDALTIDAGSFSLIGGSLSASSIYVGSSGYFIAEGTVSTPIDNDGGTVQAYGNLTLTGAETGTGTFEVNGQTLTFDNSVAAGVVDFGASAGALALAQPSNFGAAISNFGVGDTIDLTNVGYAPGEYAAWTQGTTADGGSGTLAIYASGGGSPEATLSLNGIYSQNEFALASDGAASNPGTDVDFNYILFNDGQINQESSQYDQYAPQIGPAGNTLQLTNDNPEEAASWFDSAKVSVASFTASFDYQATPSGGGLADGFAFILQDSSAGLSALGGDGSELGYSPDVSGRGGAAISPSAAVELNLYDYGGSLIPGTNFATDGSAGSYNSTGSVDFWDTGDKIQVVLSYNDSSQMLTETLTDLVTGATYSTSYTENLQSILGSNTAYVGFSAGNGGGQSTQIVSNFTLADPTLAVPSPAATTDANTPVTLSGVTVSELDPGDSITATLGVADGTPSVGAETGVTEQGVGTNSLTLVGTATAIDSALAALSYTPGTDFVGTDTLTFNASDGAIAGSQQTLSIVVNPLTDNWTYAGDGEWSAAGNWSDGVPSSDSAVNITPSGMIVVTFDDESGAQGIYSLTTNGNATLDIHSGTLVVTSGSSDTIAGPVEVDSGAAFAPQNGTLYLTANAGLVENEDNGTLTLADSVDNLGGTIATYDDGQPYGSTIALANAVTITSGAIDIGSSATGDTTDLLLVGNGDSATLSGVTIENYGTLQIDTGATLTSEGATAINNTGFLTDNGILEVNGGTLTVGSGIAIAGPGSVTITDGGTADFLGAFDQNVAFSGAGTLELAQPSTFDTNHAISGFGVGDAIDLTGVLYSSSPTVSWTQGAESGTLTVGSASFTLEGTYSLDNFYLHQDAGSGTEVVFNQPAISAPQAGGVASNFVTLDNSGYPSTYAADINDSGVIVGASGTSSGGAVGWEYDGAFAAVGVSGNFYNSATGLNDSGEISGLSSPGNPTSFYGFIETNGTYTTLSLQGTNTVDIGVNASGEIVGAVYYHNIDGVTPEFTGFTDVNGTITYLNVPSTLANNGGTYANAINDQGVVLGQYFTPGGPWQGFLYVNGTYTTIDDPNGVNTFTRGINDEGIIVGDYTDNSGMEHGFIDVNGTFTTIDDPLGAEGTYIDGINNAGQLVGSYIDSSGIQHGFVASLNDIATNEDAALTLTSLSVSGVADMTDPIAVTLGVGHGILTLESTTGLTVTGQGTDALSITGTESVINAALADGVVYAPTLDYNLTDVLTITASDNGHNASGTASTTTQYVGVIVTPEQTIANGGSLEVSAATSETAAFASASGTLILDDPSTFSGEIADISGTTDYVDLKGYDSSTVAAAGSYDSTSNTTTLTVTDPGHATLQLILAGNYSGTSWSQMSDGGNGVDIYDPPAPTAMVAIGGTLDFNAPSNATVAFAGATGTLVLDNPQTFTGHIVGFTGTAADAAHSDVIDLVGINYNSAQFSEAYNAKTGVLTVGDGTDTASITFDGFDGNFKFASDGHGGTDIFDPPASSTPAASITIGGPANDHFVFHPHLGAGVGNSGAANGAGDERLTSAEHEHWASFIADAENDAFAQLHHQGGEQPSPGLDPHWHHALQSVVNLH